MKNAIRLFIVALVLVALLIPIPALAIADPDSPPQIKAVYVYEDCLEDGDVGVLIDYTIDYTSTPNETVTEAYLVSFIDTDGSTQLKTVAPYTFQNSGYGRGLVWIRFTAAEVTAGSIDQANEALYKIWLMGNPTLSWSGDPPKTEAGIDYWQTSGSAATLIALRVLYYADLFELAWSPSLDLVEVTSQGSKLTSTGESYFENVITNLRDIAPACFSAGTVEPTLEDIDYSTTFSATATGAIIAGSPVTLVQGSQTVTATGAGTFVLSLGQGTSGTVTGAVVTGTPLDVIEGDSTITVTGAGVITIDVDLTDTTTAAEDIVVGTGWDLTTLAATFGMSRWMFSGIVWMILSVIICAGVFRATPESWSGGGQTKTVMIIFDACIVIGTLFGLLKPIVGILLFIGFGAFTGYMLFYKGANV